MNKKTKIIIIVLVGILLLVSIFFGVNYLIYKNGHNSLIWKIETKEKLQDKKQKKKKQEETKETKELISDETEETTTEQKENDVSSNNSSSNTNTNASNNKSSNTNNTSTTHNSSSSNNTTSNSNTNNSSSSVNQPSQNIVTKPACKPKEFDMSWFRPDFSTLSQCQAKGSTYGSRYGYFCDNAQDDCGTTWYMLILTDENGSYDWHTIQ